MASQGTNPLEQQWDSTEHPASAEETTTSAPPRYQHPFPFTIVPNCFIDDYVPRLSATAQSVMLVFYRLTLGWHRHETFISQRTLRQRTGIASFTTLNTALKELLAAGLVTVSDQRGQRRLQGYCLTPAALSATESGAVHDPLPSATESVVLPQVQTAHNVKKMHIVVEHPAPSATETVEEPLQKLEQYHYRNWSSSATESVVVTSSQPVLGAVPREPKERIKKSKDRSKEIDRYDRSLEMQNAMQQEAEHTNTIFSEEPSTTQSDVSASSAALASRRASLEGTGVCLPPPPDQAPPAAGEEAAEVAARRQRLLALQRELAQLKKTPSMQLLARQRIPRLEAEIKQVVTTLPERT